MNIKEVYEKYRDVEYLSKNSGVFRNTISISEAVDDMWQAIKQQVEEENERINISRT